VPGQVVSTIKMTDPMMGRGNSVKGKNMSECARHSCDVNFVMIKDITKTNVNQQRKYSVSSKANMQRWTQRQELKNAHSMLKLSLVWSQRQNGMSFLYDVIKPSKCQEYKASTYTGMIGTMFSLWKRSSLCQKLPSDFELKLPTFQKCDSDWKLNIPSESQRGNADEMALYIDMSSSYIIDDLDA
jgi:hypothetical protein